MLLITLSDLQRTLPRKISLPPRYKGDRDDRQYPQHFEVNDWIKYSMSRYQVDRAGVVLAEQDRLSCPQGRVRQARFNDYVQ